MTMIPSKIKLHRKTQTLDIGFGDQVWNLPAEFLRVHSPSAEVRGHGPGQEVLVCGKRHVGIKDLEASGNYGLRIHFDDGHDSGIYSWTYLQQLGQQQNELMQRYLEALHSAGKSRDPDTQVVQLIQP